MTIQDIIHKLYGTYIPTGIYSFEFQENRKKFTEIVMVLPPENITITEPTRSSLSPTLSGGYIVDFGNDFKQIRIQGSLHYYYVGTRSNPLAMRAEANDNMAIDGYTEFQKLRYMIIRYRDYTMTPKGKMTDYTFNGQALADINALAKKDKDKLYNNIELVFHDYDNDNHYYCKVDNFSAVQDKSDVFSIRYDISLQAYEVYKLNNKKNVETKLAATQQLVQSLDVINTCHADSLPANIPAANPDKSVLPNPINNTQETETTLTQDSDIYAKNNMLKAYRAYLIWAIGMIQAGVLDIETALKSFNTKAQLNEFISDVKL